MKVCSMVECMPIGRRGRDMSNFYNLKKKVDRAAEVPEEVAKELVTSAMVGKFIGVYLIGPLLWMFLWNYTMPYIFGVKAINYLHAFCIITMTRFLQNDKD